MRSLVPAAAALALALGLAPTAARAEDKAPDWTGYVSLYWYAVPGTPNYFNPNIGTDYKRVHVEARHNYEGVGTSSLWAGANFHAGTKWLFNATVMGGWIFGDFDGLAPGYRLTLEHSWFSLASEGEYFFSTESSEGNFFYAWTEVAGAPCDWFRAGLAGQRTRAYQTDLSIQRGPFVGFTAGSWDFALYAFNLGWEDPTYVVSVRFDF